MKENGVCIETRTLAVENKGKIYSSIFKKRLFESVTKKHITITIITYPSIKKAGKS
jgi:hypothetical protein